MAEKEYIEKRRAKQIVCDYCNKYFSDEPCEPSDCELLTFFDSEPTADVVEVVRCNHCEKQQYCRNAQYFGEDGFCSYGERKEDETD